MTSTHFLVKKKGLSFPYAFLEGDEHHHLCRVLRIKPGQRVWLFDEEEERYLAEVRDFEKERTRLLLLEKKEKEKEKIRLLLAQALIKSKKMDFLIQKAAELGVTSVIPIIALRSVVKIKKEEDKVTRWQRIAREAAKQSRRSSLPVIKPPQALFHFLLEQRADRRLLISENRGKHLRDILVESPQPGINQGIPTVLVLVGPEGGWTEAEESRALEQGYEAVCLGGQILRSETAALAAIAMIAHFWDT